MFDQSIVLNSGVRAFQHGFSNGWIDYIPGGRKLVVAFASANPGPDSQDGLRDSWSQKAILREGCSLVAVKIKTTTWYREPDLHTFFRDPRFRTLCQGFDSCLFYGGSMGGYAALAFAGAVPGADVLAFSPQTTLHPALVPWETRFLPGRRQDWSGDFVDARDSVAMAGRVYVGYDPFFKLDARHVRRLDGGNVVRLPTPFAGHITMGLLKECGVLLDVFRAILNGRPELYPKLMRSRRVSAGYYARFGKRVRAPAVKRHLFDLALARDARQVDAIHGMILLAFDSGDYKSSIEIGGRLVQPKPYSERLVAAEAGLLVVRSHAALGDMVAAKRALDDVLQIAPVDPALIPSLVIVSKEIADNVSLATIAAWSQTARRTWTGSVTDGL